MDTDNDHTAAAVDVREAVTMGVRITKDEGVVAIFDSVSGFAFGPTFADEYEAESFLAWLVQNDGRDARSIPLDTLGERVAAFRNECEAESND